jgi:hypothetical protein
VAEPGRDGGVEVHVTAGDVVVDQQPGHRVGLDRERPEAPLDQCGQQLVADLGEGGLAVRRLTERQQLGRPGSGPEQVGERGAEARLASLVERLVSRRRRRRCHSHASLPYL